MKRVLWIVTVLICSSLWANAQGLTIADMARRERAKRKAAQQQTPQKNAPITNSRLELNRPAPEEAIPPVNDSKPEESVTATTAAATTPVPSSPPREAEIEGSAAPPNEAPVRDEKWWRERFDKARADVRRAENQVAVAELEFNAANRDFLTTSFDPDGRGPKAIEESKAKWDGAKTRLDEARAKLVQLEEELRQAGAPAGWAR